MLGPSKFENITSYFVQDLTKGTILTLDTVTNLASLDRVNITNSSFLNQPMICMNSVYNTSVTTLSMSAVRIRNADIFVV